MKNHQQEKEAQYDQIPQTSGCVSGMILEPGCTPFSGYICWENGIITDCEPGTPPFEPLAKGLISPLMIDGHTHIGDSAFFGKIDSSIGLERIVNPPYGLKHMLLSNSDDEEIIHGMERSFGNLLRSGTGHFLDFREGGPEGIILLEKAFDRYRMKSGMLLPNPIIFSRPSSLHYDKEEMDSLCKLSTGIGISSVLDWEYSELEKVADHAIKAGKLLAIHASETQREDIDGILDLKPNILIHLTAATASDLERVADEDIDTVICPRTNSLFGFLPDIPLMLENGIRLTLGTDNFMFNEPDPLENLRFAYELTYDRTRHHAHPPSLADIFKMTGFHMKKVLNVKSGISPGQKPGFMVLAMDSGHPGTALRTLISGSRIHTIVDGKTLWRQ